MDQKRDKILRSRSDLYDALASLNLRLKMTLRLRNVRQFICRSNKPDVHTNRGPSKNIIVETEGELHPL